MRSHGKIRYWTRMREQYRWGGWEEKREGEKFEEKIAGRYL